VRKHAVETTIPGMSRGPTPKGARWARRPSRPRPGRGKPQGGRKPRRARRAKACRDAESSSQRDRGSKSLQRGRTGPAVRDAAAITNGPSMIRIAGNAKGFPARTEPCAEVERRRRHVRAGETETAERCVRKVGDAATPIARGEAGPRGSAIRVVSSSEGETPRARPDEKFRGDRDGSNASKSAGTAGTHQDPEEATPGMVARHDGLR